MERLNCLARFAVFAWLVFACQAGAEEVALSKLGSLDRALVELERERHAATLKLELARERIFRLEAQIEEAKAQTLGLDRALKNHFKHEALRNAEGKLQRLAGYTSIEDYVLREIVERKVMQKRQALWLERKQALAALQDKRAEIQKQETEAGALLATLDEQSRVIGGAKQERQRHVRRLRGIKDPGRKLSSLVQDIMRRAREAQRERKLATPRHALDWPLKGKVLRKADEGLHIRANLGEPVKSVLEGKAVYVGWMRGYGQVVILDHSKNLHTLYAHLSNTAASQGDLVKTGQVIGYAGETESVEGPQLYFELRHEGMPQNPLPWLKVRSR